MSALAHVRARVTSRHPRPNSQRIAVLRLLAPALLALVALAAAGHVEDGLLIAMGAAIAVIGSGQPARRRLCTLVSAALLLVVAIGTGYRVADVFLTLILWNLILAVVATAVDVALPLRPLGPWPLVLMVDVGSLLGMAHFGLTRALLDVGLGSLVGVVVGLADAWWAERRAATPWTGSARSGRPVRPWSVVAGFLEGYIAVLLSSTFTHATRDRHPFWPVLLVVLLVARPGPRGPALRRALRCLEGALLAVLVFAPLSRVHLHAAVLVALVVVLTGLAGALIARYDGAAAFAVALLALLVTEPLLPSLSLPALVLQHGVDALVAAALSLLMFRLLRRPSREAPPTA
jgi:hypothetical protein